MITQSQLKELLSYESMTGVFTWKPRGVEWWDRRYAGTIAGCRQMHCNNKYIKISIKLSGEKKKRYFAHRLAWLYEYGYFPDKVDHEDHNGMNNAVGNLRDVSSGENQKNIKMRSDNVSGHTGICWNVAKSKWHLQINSDGLRVVSELFADINDAVEYRNKCWKKYNFHMNHGGNNG